MGVEQSSRENELLAGTEKIFPEGYADDARKLIENKGGEMLDRMKRLPHYLGIVKKNGPDSDKLIFALLEDLKIIEEIKKELASKFTEIENILKTKNTENIIEQPGKEGLANIEALAGEYAKNVDLWKVEKK